MKGERKSKLLKGLWRFEYACTAMDRVVATCDLVAAIVPDDNQPLYYPLIAAICVTYNKPFTANKGLGELPKEFEVLGDPKLQHTHDIIVNSRNYMYAHTDLTKMVAVDPEMGTKESIYKLIVEIHKEPGPVGDRLVFGRGIVEPKLKSVVIPDIKALCLEQKRRFKKHADEYTQKLFARQRVTLGRHILEVGQQPW